MADPDVAMSNPRPKPQEPDVPSIGGEPVIPPPQASTTGPDPSAPAIPDGDAQLVASAQGLAITVDEQAPPVTGIAGVGGRHRGDRIFAWLASSAAASVIIIVALVAIFLVLKSWQSLADDKTGFLTSTHWSTTPDDFRFGVAGLLWTTVLSSVIALVIAVPVAVGIALFITQYAPRRLAHPVAYIIDLLAAIPSIIYGVWGYSELAPHLSGVVRTLDNLGIGLFDRKLLRFNVFDAGVVLSIMILPIITAISRDVFARTPRQNIEAAWALGATRWEMIRLAVLPYGRPGVVSGAMLGLGRALGETIAVMLILNTVSHFSFSMFDGGTTFASKIALNVAEFSTPQSTGAYIAAGLVLFVVTFIVNAAARWVVNRRREFS